MGEATTCLPKWKTWKNWFLIIKSLFILELLGEKKTGRISKTSKIHQINAPDIELSATEIRKYD